MGLHPAQPENPSADPAGRTELPSYDELPLAPQGGRSAWGMFGPDDQVGLVNLMTRERVLAASRLVRKGAVFPLNAPVDAFEPGTEGEGAAKKPPKAAKAAKPEKPVKKSNKKPTEEVST